MNERARFNIILAKKRNDFGTHRRKWTGPLQTCNRSGTHTCSFPASWYTWNWGHSDGSRLLHIHPHLGRNQNRKVLLKSRIPQVEGLETQHFLTTMRLQWDSQLVDYTGVEMQDFKHQIWMHVADLISNISSHSSISHREMYFEQIFWKGFECLKKYWTFRKKQQHCNNFSFKM